jgi:outer membrane protein assembly factor BamB
MLSLAGVLLAAVSVGVVANPALEPDRNKALPAARSLPVAQWRRSLLRSSRAEGETARWLRFTVDKLRGQGEPVLAPFTPVAVSRPKREGDPANPETVPLMIYRSQWGTHAVNRTNGTLEWETPSKWSLDGMSMSPARSQAINTWMTFYLTLGQQPAYRQAMVFENSAVGTFSNDAKFVYVIEDFQVSPPVTYEQTGTPPAPRAAGFPGSFAAEIDDAVRHSRLQAFEIATGKLKWELEEPAAKNELADCYFSGPVLPHEGRIYTLIRREGVPPFAALFANPAYAVQPLRACFWKTGLISIDPKRPKLLSCHTLLLRAEARFPIWQRLRAAPLLVANDVFVCPTDTGAMIGVDRTTGKQRWEYGYREEADDRNAALRNPPRTVEDMWMTRFPPWSGPWWRMYPWWRYAPPALHGDRLVFTPSFSTAVHCIDVRDGKPLWQSPRDEDDLYLAGIVGDTVLVVGKKSLRALRLSTGKRLWEIATGMPCGYGAVRDGCYYLPIEAEPRGKVSEIAVIDVAAGKVRARLRSADDHPVGNLLFFGDQMISQSIWEIAAYPLPELAERSGMP